MISRTWTAFICLLTLGLVAGWIGDSTLADGPSYEPDPFVGLYTGTLTDDSGSTLPARAFVYAQGGWFTRGRDVYYARFEWNKDQENWVATPTITLKIQDKRLVFPDEMGSVDGKTLACREKSGQYELKRTEIPSPTLGEKPPEGAIVLLPFEPGKAPSQKIWDNPTWRALETWDNPEWQALDDGSVVVGKGDIRTGRTFVRAGYRLHIEFMLPIEPGGRGQNRANSGIYINDRYEVQVLDSFGLAPEKNTCGAIYGVYAPLVNAARPAGQWQAYDIAVVSHKPDVMLQVKLNGVEIQPWRIVTGPTAGGAIGEAAYGSLRLQDHGHLVRYRNIWIEYPYLLTAGGGSDVYRIKE